MNTVNQGQNAQGSMAPVKKDSKTRINAAVNNGRREGNTTETNIWISERF